jgi:hypothetical protein
MKAVFISVAVLAVFTFGVGASTQVATPPNAKISGVYLSAADYQDARLAFEGACRSKGHKLELHNVSNKPYIDVTHDMEKRRYQKSNLFGVRACDGHDYRFGSNLEYRILETKELYIYTNETRVRAGRGYRTVLTHYFSAGPEGKIFPLTLGNLKLAFPADDMFLDSLGRVFGNGGDLAQYDDFAKMYKVNQVLTMSRESEH